jgi:hypothetical protein
MLMLTHAEFHILAPYAECCILFTIMLNGCMLSVIMLNVVMLSVAAPKNHPYMSTVYHLDEYPLGLMISAPMIFLIVCCDHVLRSCQTQLFRTTLLTPFKRLLLKGNDKL